MTITQSFSKLSAVAAGIAIAFALIAGVFATATPANAAALTSAQVSSIIGLLQSFGADAATIANVQASLTGGTPTTPSTGGSTGACPALSRSLQQGSTGADVMALQKFLNATAATQVSVSGAGSPGLESSYFGPATKAAVTKFQTLNNVSAIGIVGPATRAAIAAVCGGTTTNPGTPSGPGITVSAGAQPANALAPQGAARVPFTTFTITNNSGVVQTINGVTVERNGLGIDGNFSGIVLLDSTNNVQLGIAKTLNSNHQAVIGDNFTINPGQTMTLTVAGNISNVANVSGQIVSLKIVAVASTAAVSGVLPIMGASHTINSTLALGSVSTTTSSFDPGATSNRNIGDTAIRFSGVRFTASSVEDLKLYSIRWRQTGTASAADISNIVTYVNGVAYPTTVDSSGKYYTASIAGGALIAKGNSVDVYVQGDLTGSNSASRNVKFDIDRVTDVYFVGQLYGYGVAPSGTYTPWFSGFTATINPGTVTLIGKANEVPAANVAPGVNGQVLGGFATNFAGESVSIQGLTLTVSTSSTLGPLTSVTIVDSNGLTVAGPVDQSGSTVTFTDSITFPTGRKVYTVKGKIASGAANNSTIYLTVTPSNWTNPTGQTSGSSIPTVGSAGAFDLNTMTVKAATLSATASSQPAAQVIVAGAQGAVLGTIQLDGSQSGEDVRVSTIPVYFNAVSGSLQSYLSGCVLWDGSTQLTTGSRVMNTIASGNNNFQLDNTLTVTKGTVKSLSVSCNVGTGATTQTGQFGVNGGSWAATGVTSGTSVTVSAASGVYSGLVSVGSGAFTLAVDASSPSYTVVAGNTQGVTGTVIKLRSTNEQVTVNKIGLSLTSGDGTDSYNDVTSADIYDGATLLGTAYFTGSNETATSSLNSSITLTKDTDKILTVKLNLAGIGTGMSGKAGKLIAVNPINAEGSGLSSGLTLRIGASGSSAGLRAFKSYPVVSTDTLTAAGANGNTALMRFKVAANNAGPVGISQLKFTIATSTNVAVTNANLYVYSDASYSNAIGGQGASGLIGSGNVAPNASNVVTISPTTNPIAVPAGNTYYFELRGTVTPSNTTYSIVTTLNGDSAYPTGLTAGYYVATSSSLTTANNFVWSGNSTTTAAFSDVDWANGYGVPGLGANGLTQSRSN